MTHYRDLFPTPHICADDLRGREYTLTILSWQLEDLVNDHGRARKPVLYFHEAEKGLVLNVTNAKTIARLYGPNLERWIGQRITLYPTTEPSFGETKDVVRVRPDLPPPPPPTDPTE